MPNLFEYNDYREYLREYYEEQKRRKPGFSYRWFSQQASINSSAFLYYVITGRRNLTKSSTAKISRAIGHDRAEAEYFEMLVFFNQARTVTEKSTYYGRIVELRRPLDIPRIGEERYEYYSAWYHSVIRELVTIVDFRDDFAALGRFLVPPISAAKAKASIALLERLGFLELMSDGTYEQTDQVIAAGTKNPVQAFVLEKFQLEMLTLAGQSYDRIPRPERFSSSTTFSISAPTYELFKMRTREFRRELMEIARLDTSMDRAYQLTINLFPLSRRREDSEQ
jgi:uncharacterized protein (TIGR02147 family)